MFRLQMNSTQGLIAAVLVVVFAVLGLWYGAPPESALAGSFGAVVRAFAQETQTRMLLTAILIDVVTGVIAALRSGVFRADRIGGFLSSNVIAYMLGYMLFWYISYFGLIDLVPPGVAPLIASLGFGAAMASLGGSIIDNFARAQAGTTPPHDAIAVNLSPVDPQG